MPGYYDWKIRNCTEGAQYKAALLMNTFIEVDKTLERLWAEKGESFSEEENAKLAAIVEVIDSAEDALEKAKLMLAEFLPGRPDGA